MMNPFELFNVAEIKGFTQKGNAYRQSERKYLDLTFFHLMTQETVSLAKVKKEEMDIN